jgi:outer membrane protein assembly factor BamB
VAKDAKGLDVLSLAMASNAVIEVTAAKAASIWQLTARNPGTGEVIWSNTLPGEPLPSGLTVDRDGRIAVTMLDGSVACYEGKPAAPLGGRLGTSGNTLPLTGPG